MNGKSSIAQLLCRFPSFEFDLAEFILATTFRDAMEAKYRECLGDPQQEEEQKQGILRALCTDISMHVPAYSQLEDICSFSDIPVIDKDKLRINELDFLDSRFAAPVLWERKTSGTTGTPVSILYESSFYFDSLFQAPLRIGERAGFLPSDPTRSQCVSITDNRACRETIWPDPTGRFGPMIQAVIDESRPKTLSRLTEIMEHTWPVSLAVKPSILEMLLAWREAGLPMPRHNMDYIICSGAYLNEDLRANVEQVLEVPVVNAYGLTEFGIFASECHCQEGLHLDSNVLVEVLDDRENAVSSGEVGHIVVSSLRNRAFPLIRYRSGDLGSLSREQCPCGSNLPRLVQLTGRTVKCFKLPGGRLFSPTHFNDLFSRFPIREFQVTQRCETRFDVTVEPQPDCVALSDLVRDIAVYVQDCLSASVEVVVSVETFRSKDKFERYRLEI